MDEIHYSVIVSYSTESEENSENVHHSALNQCLIIIVWHCSLLMVLIDKDRICSINSTNIHITSIRRLYASANRICEYYIIICNSLPILSNFIDAYKSIPYQRNIKLNETE